MSKHGRREEERSKKKFLNDLISEIKNKLRIKTAATTISDVDLYKVAMNLSRVEKFKSVVRLAKREREIIRKPVQGF